MGKKTPYKKVNPAKWWKEPEGGWSPEVYMMNDEGTEPRVGYNGRPVKRKGRRKSKASEQSESKVEVKPTPEVIETPAPEVKPTDTGGSLIDDAVVEMDKIREFLPDDGEPITYGELANESEKPPSSVGGETNTDGLPDEWGSVDDTSAPPPPPTTPTVNAMAEVVVNSFIGVGIIILGEDFAPENNAERETLVKPTSDYLDTLDMDDVPAWVVFVLAFGSYTAIKFKEPSVRKRAVEFKEKIQNRGKKKEAVELEPSEEKTEIPKPEKSDEEVNQPFINSEAYFASGE